MNAKEYLKKAIQVCEEHEDENCNACPLRSHGCGIPKEMEDIDATIDLVEKYERPKTSEQEIKKDIREVVKLLEAAAEEIENCYSGETELTEKLREFAGKQTDGR